VAIFKGEHEWRQKCREEHEAKMAARKEASVPADETIDISPDEPSGGKYDGWSRRDLIEECESRGLAAYGTKAAMTERLEADDAA
jgi:hypothetical protein